VLTIEYRQLTSHCIYDKCELQIHAVVKDNPLEKWQFLKICWIFCYETPYACLTHIQYFSR